MSASAKIVDLGDAGGFKVSNVAEIDGMLVPMWKGSLEIAAECLRAIPDMQLRDDDVMLSTYAKAGTHWGYEILSMLLQGSTERKPNHKTETWVEFAPPADLDKAKSPRVLNSHLPLDRLPRQLKEKKNKVVVVMRNPKDVAVSLYHHVKSERTFQYNGEFKDCLAGFMEGNIPFGSWFDYTVSVEKAVNNNEMDIHVTYFEDLKENGVEEIQKIATFLELDIDEKLCRDINDACAFNKMAVEKALPKAMAEAVFRDGFGIFRKGIIGDWKNYFTVAQNEAFDKLYAKKMAASKFKFKFEASQKD